MRIRKLEICGFKSFVDRTVIHFDQDVIGIVGPNGCGKSNVVDAIRWCMGEQSAKQLRGKAMDDVIFAGSDSRSPHGFAEVTITFANADAEVAATLPIEYRDYPEIAVTRKLYRDGTSEYLVNKTQVRLKDITDLFLGTGVGAKAYSIVEQGKIGLIVSAKPEDRRLLIEEAAGITKYKYRKKQAEKKMDLTRQNLLRIGDLVAEIERNLSSLKRQAAKAERFVSYRNEHEDLSLHEASHKLLELIALYKVEVEAFGLAQEASTASRAQLDARDAQVAAARAEMLQLEQRTDKAQNEAFASDNEVRTCEAETQRSIDKLQHLAERQRASGEEAKRIAANAESLETERSSIHGTVENLLDREADEQERLHVEEAKLRSLESDQRSLDAQAGNLRKTYATSTAAAAASEARLTGFDNRVSDTRLRREKLSIDSERLLEDRRESDRRREEAENRVRDLNIDVGSVTGNVADFEASLRKVREEIGSSEKELEHSKTEFSQQRGRLKALEELHARLEGVGAGPRALIETRDPAIVGLVADLVEAPEDLIQPFAALMGERLQVVVMKDLDRGRLLLEGIAARRIGRATVIAQDAPFVSELDRSRDFGQGVSGYLVDRLIYTPENESMVRRLASDALLVDDHETAARLQNAGVTNAIVTLNGSLYRPDGTISGGTGDAVGAALLQQKRKLRELRLSVSEQEARVDVLATRHTELRSQQADFTTSLDRARSTERELQIEKVTADNDLRRGQDSVREITKRIEQIAREVDDLDGRLDEFALERDQAMASLVKARDDAAKSAEELTKAESKIRDFALLVTEQMSICTDRKVGFARIKEQATSARSTIDRLTRSIDELTTRAQQLEAEAFDAALTGGRVAANLFKVRESMIGALSKASVAHQDFDSLKKALDEVRNALGVHEADIKGIRTTVEGLVDKARKHESSMQRLQIEREHLISGVSEKFRGKCLPKLLGDYHMRSAPDAELRSRITELANLIDRMGPVNLDAVEEYKKESERFAYYSSQKADLEKALDDLEKAIQQMNKESKRLFKLTYDSVNTRFKDIFPRMFRGGRAELVLTNPEDLLETGVEIVAQPPGKKVQTIELLSGGEKALTAVSLIFAIFQHKPSPFCVLDEVDAPLDEANVTRFNEMIRNMTGQSQFILITHIKRTMQSVDVLYGVTMQELGVSKVVSVKVNDKAPALWAQTKAGAVA